MCSAAGRTARAVAAGGPPLMRAVVVSQPGDADVLRIGERPDPVPAGHEVRIRVAAAGLNGADLSQRRGFYPSPPGAPEWPGLEVSGTIDAVGDDVDRVARRRPGLRAPARRRLRRAT